MFTERNVKSNCIQLKKGGKLENGDFYQDIVLFILCIYTEALWHL